MDNLVLVKYARKCDCCGKGMNSGFHDVGSYYCSERCLIWGNSEEKTYTMEDWQSDCNNNDDCYYTEWDEIDDDYYYDEEGNEYSLCSNCQEVTSNLGDYCSQCLTSN